MTMRRRLSVGVLWLFAVSFGGAISPALSDDLSKEERDAGFVSMFNGKDFTGWRFDGKESPPKDFPDNWKVEDGLIKLSGGGKPNLGTAMAYADFEMRFEWRAVKDKYNSGFFIRSGEKVGAHQINLAKGHEGAFIGGKINGAKEVPTLQKAAGSGKMGSKPLTPGRLGHDPLRAAGNRLFAGPAARISDHHLTCLLLFPTIVSDHWRSVLLP